MSRWITSRLPIAATTLAALALAATAALASQGPGTSAGTANGVIQTAMAVVIYGSCAAVIAAGLIGAVRKH